MNGAKHRLIGLIGCLLLIGLLSYRITRQKLDIAPGESGLPLGMRWLQRSYQLDEDTFAEIQRRHRSYVVECEKRCLELNQLNRLFLTELRTRNGESDLPVLQSLQAALCHNCRMAMIRHVHEVAGLMPENASREFLGDFQSTLLPKKARPDPALR